MISIRPYTTGIRPVNIMYGELGIHINPLKLLGPNLVIMAHSCESLVAGTHLLGTKAGGDCPSEMDLDAMMEVN